jgi:hypothetical protein
MDGLAKSNALVFVLCATNLPWELDMVGGVGSGGGSWVGDLGVDRESHHD